MTIAAVLPDEEVSRFIRSRNDLRKGAFTIRPDRLQPARNKINGRLELSICRTSGMRPSDIHSVCRVHFDVYQRPGVASIGRCVANAGVVLDEGLHFDADGVPYAQHANVVGWKDVPGAEVKSIRHLWIEQTIRMSDRFKFVAHDD